MTFLTILFLCVLPFQEVPLKPVEEFEIDLDYTFKQRVLADRNKVHFQETRGEYDRRTHTGPLPHLVINVKIHKLAGDEARIRLENNKGRRFYTNRRVAEGDVIPVQIGFTDDAKDGVTANEYTLFLLSSDKRDLSRVTIVIDEDGHFFVNGEKRGRF